MPRIRGDKHGRIGLIGLAIVVMVILIAVVVAAVWTDPGRAMNHCRNPVRFAKASGAYQVTGLFGNIGGNMRMPDVAVYDDSRISFLAAADFGSFFGAKGKAWVTTSVSGLGVSIEDWKSKEQGYDFPALKLQSGTQDGSFTSGEACFESRGTTTWTFKLVVQPNGEPERTVATVTRTVDI